MIEEFYKVFYEIEELMLKQGIKCLTTTELHVIEAVGNDELTMNELSDKLGITMGTATVAVNKLNDKGFIKRERSSDDRRKVFVTLSKKGLEALKYHDLFHKTIIAKITKDLSNGELEEFSSIFGKLLKNLNTQLDFISPQLINQFPKNTTVKIIEIKGSKGMRSFYRENAINEGTIATLLNKDKAYLKLEIEGKEIELDIADSKNLVAVNYEA
ncbi:MAG: winged helix-turn-helix transcriptional regulator [Fusobacteriaceae bacterium]|nr:winged helix-turn-helix transcriptional regulator [Fusobacteriaceae bacterium]MBP6467920.1 winged helix-turn-helix transcriptional regulator [Fusobacteriaceae bacterium]MBP9595571.1 winged helix-turn-helix transcriptional regulator [Fusobacteriaceae bacterium]